MADECDEERRHPFHHDHTVLLDAKGEGPATIQIPQEIQNCGGKVVEAVWDSSNSSWRFLRVHPSKSVADDYRTVADAVGGKPNKCCELSDLTSVLLGDKPPFSPHSQKDSQTITQLFIDEFKRFWVNLEKNAWDHGGLVHCFYEENGAIVINRDSYDDTRRSTFTPLVPKPPLTVLATLDFNNNEDFSCKALIKATGQLHGNGAHVLVVEFGQRFTAEQAPRKSEVLVTDFGASSFELIHLWTKHLDSMVHLLSPSLRDLCIEETGVDKCLSGYVMMFTMKKCKDLKRCVPKFYEKHVEEGRRG